MVKREDRARQKALKLYQWHLDKPEGRAQYQRHVNRMDKLRARKRRLIEKLLQRPGFREELDLIRKNYLEGKYSIDERQRGHDMREPYRELRKKYQLDSNWVLWIHRYVSDGINDPNKLYFVRYRVNKEKSTVPVVELLIFPETLREDIDRLWPFIAFELARTRTWQGERIRPTGKKFKTPRGKAREAKALQIYDLIENYHEWFPYEHEKAKERSRPTNKELFLVLAARSSTLGLDDFDWRNASNREIAQHDKRLARRIKELYYLGRRRALT